MTSQVRYQVFISSTYESLREERQQTTQAVLEAGFFPSGMELFPASDDTQWELIKRVISESDYYVVILGGRYGSLAADNVSYTEKEYDYAVEIGVPVLGFVRKDVGNISFSQTEQTDEGRERLEQFRAKVLSRTCRPYSSATELGMVVLKSLIAETRVRPRVGWVRADQARTDIDIEREHRLSEELEEAKELIEALEREIRDGVILADEIPREELAQGEDVLQLAVTFSDSRKQLIRRNAELTWDELFKIIGSSIYGYIVRRTSQFGQASTYPFEQNLEEHIRWKLIDQVQGRKIKIESSQLDACIIQFKELGLLKFAEKIEDDGKEFRGIILTELGERRLTSLSAHRRIPRQTSAEPEFTNRPHKTRRTLKETPAFLHSPPA